MSHHDCQPYYLRTGDEWTKIDYTKKPSDWMKPLVKGQETGLVEIPANWYLDDLPPMMFIKNSANSHGWVNPRYACCSLCNELTMGSFVGCTLG